MLLVGCCCFFPQEMLFPSSASYTGSLRANCGWNYCVPYHHLNDVYTNAFHHGIFRNSCFALGSFMPLQSRGVGWRVCPRPGLMGHEPRKVHRPSDPSDAVTGCSPVAWLRSSSTRPCRSAWTPTCAMCPGSSMSGWPQPPKSLTCRGASTAAFFSPSSVCPRTRNPK